MLLSNNSFPYLNPTRNVAIRIALELGLFEKLGGEEEKSLDELAEGTGADKELICASYMPRNHYFNILILSSTHVEASRSIWNHPRSEAGHVSLHTLLIRPRYPPIQRWHHLQVGPSSHMPSHANVFTVSRAWFPPSKASQASSQKESTRTLLVRPHPIRPQHR